MQPIPRASAGFMLILAIVTAVGADEGPSLRRECDALRAAIQDLATTFGPRYARSSEYLARLESLASRLPSGDSALAPQLAALRQEALLANPLLHEHRLLLVKRRPQPWKKKGWKPSPGLDIGMPSNHECNTSLSRDGYDNELAVLWPLRPDGQLRTLFRPAHDGYVGEMDLHPDGQRLLFTQSDPENWKIWEINADGTGLRQISRTPADVDAFDACYLPDGRITFACTASFQAVPCWHGLRRVCNLYQMGGDGSAVRQLCFDQDHDLHPVVLPNGQVMYSRWDYTGISHIFLRELMVMNPDGTGQRAVYGSNSWFPNSLYFPRPLPSEPNRLVCILSGYHGPHRMGQLVLVDLARGWHETDGLVKRISGRGDPIRRLIRDDLIGEDWPKFLHPYPLSDKHFLVAGWTDPQSPWRIYLADVFDNLVLVHEAPGFALLEPVPLRATPAAPAIPDRVDLARHDATVYLHDIYTGPGLAGVPRGTVKSLRVFAYHFGYPGLAGPDRIGYGGPWEVMRILGTAPIEDDGSANFTVPANTPIAFQALDGEGKAVQWMRSWVTAMPGENVSCLGCHETPRDTGPVRLASSALRAPRKLTPWYGPPRGFDFVREVQPVLDRYCVSCHNGPGTSAPDLRRPEHVPDYRGQPLSALALKRLPAEIKAQTHGVFPYAPAYDALVPYLRRVNIEDDVSLLVPGEYHADTSPLVQLLRKGHQGVRLDSEAWDRLITWIDLNAPCHGTWGQVAPIPGGAHQRRMELRRQYGGPLDDPELTASPPVREAQADAPRPALSPIHFTGHTAPSAQRASPPQEPQERTVDLGPGVSLKLLRIPAGRFTPGDKAGQPDEQRAEPVHIEAFWMGALEVTNQQYRCFDPTHNPQYYAKRHQRADDQGLPLDEPQQPVLRVSWHQAMDFCRWLSQKTGLRCTLPTEAQWEYACRAGATTPLHFGETDADFSAFANLADRSFAAHPPLTGGLEQMVPEGAGLADGRFDDHFVVTAPAGSYQPNAWGLRDMHGNAAEWTRTTYRPYPYRTDDGRDDAQLEGRKVVRGGSFFDPPRRARSAYRSDYPAWQRVFNVGFRVVAE